MNISINYFMLMPFLILTGGVIILSFMGVLKDKVKNYAGVIASLFLFADLYYFVKLLSQVTYRSLDYMNGMVYYNAFNIYLSILVLVCGIASFVLAEGFFNSEEFKHPEFYAIVLASITGLLVMINTNNLINLFIGLELTSIPLYATVAYLRYKEASVEGALKYFILGSIASGFFLFGIAVVYGATGSVVFKDIMVVKKGDELFKLGLLFLMVGIGFKASAAPFHMWTPDAYEGAPTPVTAFMSIAPKAVAIVILVKVLYIAFPDMFALWEKGLFVIAILTVLIGNFGALVQNSVKRMLAYSSIAHAGYLLMAIVAFSIEGISSILFYLAGYLLINIGAFGSLSLLKIGDNDYVEYNHLRGIGYKYPLFGLLLSIFMFSLAGIPATIGFVGKFYVFKSLIVKEQYVLALIGILGSLVSVYYYLKVVVFMYMKENPEEREFNFSFLTLALLVLCAVGVIYFGIFPQGINKFAILAAKVLI